MSAVVQTGSSEARSACGTKLIVVRASARTICGAASAAAPARLVFTNSRRFIGGQTHAIVWTDHHTPAPGRQAGVHRSEHLPNIERAATPPKFEHTSSAYGASDGSEHLRQPGVLRGLQSIGPLGRGAGRRRRMARAQGAASGVAGPPSGGSRLRLWLVLPLGAAAR